MQIRLALPADEAGVRACAEAAYARYVPLIGREPAPMVADFAAQIAAGEVRVATGAAGAVDGFIVFRVKGSEMFLENVAVRPEMAGRGLGGALIARCEAEAVARGCGSVVLYTNAKMEGNLTLYPKLGYAETGRRIEDGFDRVYFEKRLA